MENLIKAINQMPEVHRGFTKEGNAFIMGYDPGLKFCAMVVNKKQCYSKSFKDPREWESFKEDLKELIL